MEFTGTHRFESSLDEVAAAFLDPDAQVARYGVAGASDVETLRLEVGHTALDLKTVRTVQGEVPKLAQRIIQATNTVTTTERWEYVDDVLTGSSLIEASSVPGTATTEATIVPAGEHACTYTIVLTLHLKVPLIGERFVKLLRPQVMEIVDAEFEAWDTWFTKSVVA